MSAVPAWNIESYKKYVYIYTHPYPRLRQQPATALGKMRPICWRSRQLAGPESCGGLFAQPWIYYSQLDDDDYSDDVAAGFDDDDHDVMCIVMTSIDAASATNCWMIASSVRSSAITGNTMIAVAC